MSGEQGSPQDDNKRVFPRTDAFLPARIKHDGQELKALTVDISAGGMSLQLRAVPKMGSVVDVAIEFPSGRQISTRAEVVRVIDADEHVVGLRYVNVPQEFLEAAWNYVVGRARR